MFFTLPSCPRPTIYHPQHELTLPNETICALQECKTYLPDQQAIATGTAISAISRLTDIIDSNGNLNEGELNQEFSNLDGEGKNDHYRLEL